MSSATPPRCDLDEAGLRDQGARYARLAPSVLAVEREPRALTVRFGPDLDVDLLEEALAVERRCCPFFELDFEGRGRRLRASVSEAEHASALDALAAALT
ncbi:MAG TPA: hypothetical protein VJT75_01740 [Thermoleophilaceae bacterium]|nr:hypothetical protein [Thermoleophilaceae bacterium]